MLLQIDPSLPDIILGILYRTTQSLLTAGYHAYHQGGGHTEGGRNFRSIQHTQPPAGTCPDVKEAATLLHPRYDLRHQPFYLRDDLLYGLCHFLVFCIDFF